MFQKSKGCNVNWVHVFSEPIVSEALSFFEDDVCCLKKDRQHRMLPPDVEQRLLGTRRTEEKTGTESYSAPYKEQEQ